MTWMTSELKLTVEFVPEPLWGLNPRTEMGRAEWDRVRKQVYADASHQCEICGAAGRLEAHEVWQYDDEKFVQRLVRLTPLCGLCHGVKHFGRSALVLREEEKTRLSEHFVVINGCSRQMFAEHVRAELAKYKARSAHSEWTVDWGKYSELVK